MRLFPSSVRAPSPTQPVPRGRVRLGRRHAPPLLPGLLAGLLATAGAPWLTSAAPTSAWAEGPAPGPAAAAQRTERPRVAHVKLTFVGNVAEAARELFAQRLVEGLSVAEFQVSAGAAVVQRLTTSGIDPSSCADEPCFRRAGPALGVAYLVSGAVNERQKTYEITLDLISGRTGALIGTHRERCEICGVEEAAEKMGLAASALRTRLEGLVRAPARFVIRSRPAGAAVAIDGQAIGRTPLDRELPGGLHTLQVSAEGYDPSERTLNVVSGVDETLDLELLPLASKFPFARAGWTAIALGVIALASGIWAEAVDGRELSCASTERDPWGHCPQVRDTRALGAALIGVGGAAATLGGVWLYLGQGRGPRGVGDAAAPSSVALGYSGRF
jgi:TolB-like protein